MAVGFSFQTLVNYMVGEEPKDANTRPYGWVTHFYGSVEPKAIDTNNLAIWKLNRSSKWMIR